MTSVGESKTGLRDPISTPRFAGHVSFFRLPVVEDLGSIDVAVCGIPFDGGIGNRTGARHGPRQIREMSVNSIRPYHPVSNLSPFHRCRFGDVGDSPVNPIDLNHSLELMKSYFDRIDDAGAIPLVAGGDHLVTLPVLRSIARRGPVGLVHLDAHADTFDYFFDERFRYNHGTTFRRAVEEGLIDPKRCIQIGLRGTRFTPTDLDFSIDSGMRVITIEEYFDLGVQGVCAEISRVIGSGRTYVSIDVDGLDAVYVPGTGAPEIGGYSPRDAQLMIRSLGGKSIVGADVVEVSPPLDPSGGTARVAAVLMFELADVIAQHVCSR
ncbi:MAG: agmatinase [Alphaproteobacteria bacterium]